MTVTTPARRVEGPPTVRQRPVRHHVTAVLVSHNGSLWLPRVLDALADQTRPIDVLVAVDTGSDDGSLDLLRARLGETSVLSTGRRTGFGDAVRLGLAHEGGPDDDVTEWVWLVHDDCAPQPQALAHLLDAAGQSTMVGVVGPKLVDWDEPSHLLEVGVSVSRGGRRSSGVTANERDQGQHDHRTDVLAVGTAGMLVNRHLWDRLGGLDPALALLRDDVDLCWRAHLAGRRVVLAPRAVVADAQASTRGLRAVHAVRAPLRRVDRQHGLQVELARCSWPALPFVLAWLLVGGLVRATGLLVAKAVRPAVDELVSTLAVALTPWTWLGLRWRARGTRSVRRRDVAGLLTPRLAFVRHGLERVGGLAGHEAADESALVAAEPGPVADESDPVRLAPARWPRRLLRHPMTSVLLAVAAMTAVATRGLTGGLSGGLSARGALAGGELAPAQGRSLDLWHAALDGWSGPGLGAASTASPAALVRAAATTLLAPVAGDDAPARAVDMLLLGAPVLAAISAYVAAGLVARSRWARGWAALAWASLPLLTSGISGGRLGPVAAYVLLPIVAAAVAKALTPRGAGAWRSTCVAALGLALVVSALPLLLIAVLLVGVGGALLGHGLVRVRAILLLVLTPALLGPWLEALVDHPRRLLAGPGVLVVSPASTPLDAITALAPLPALVPGWAAAGVVGMLLVAGLAGLLRTGARGNALLAGWVLGLLGLAAALAAPAVVVAQTPNGPAHVWAGVGLLLLALAVVASAVAGADGLRGRLARHRFGWRQLLVAPVVAAAVLAPVTAGVAWAWRGAENPLQRNSSAPPAVAVDAARGPLALRTLVIGADGGDLTYRLDGAEPAAWSRERLGLSQAAGSPVAAVVASLTGASPTAKGLRELAVGFVVVQAAAPAQVRARLDTVAGLVHLGSDRGAALWRVQQPQPRVSLDTEGKLTAVPVSGSHSAVDTTVGPGASGRRLLLSEPVSPGWQATLDGARLTPVRDAATPWRQAFAVPSAGGLLVVSYDDPVRRWWLLGQGALAAALLLLALPGRSRVPR